MAGFPVTAAAIGLTSTAFSLCVESLQMLSRAQTSPQAMLGFNTGIELATARLLLWGQNSGVTSGQLDPSLEPVKELLDRMLGSLSASLQDAKELKIKYGIHLVEVDDGDSQPSLTKNGVDILSLPLPVLHLALESHRRLSQKLTKQASVFRRLRWAVVDGDKALNLLKDIEKCVDGLNQLLTESQRASLDAEMTAMKIAILGTKWVNPTATLASIEGVALSSYNPIAMPARLSRLRLEMELEGVAPTLAGGSLVADPPLHLAYDKIQPLDSCRSLAKHAGKDIIIEWRLLRPAERKGENGKARAKQTAKLVRLLQELRHSATHYPILESIGFVDQKDHEPARLGSLSHCRRVLQGRVRGVLFRCMTTYHPRDLSLTCPLSGSGLVSPRTLLADFFSSFSWVGIIKASEAISLASFSRTTRLPLLPHTSWDLHTRDRKRKGFPTKSGSAKS